MMFRVADAGEKGHKSVMFLTRNTAVVVLALLLWSPTLDVQEHLVSYGTGKILTAHLFVKALGPSKLKRLPLFYAGAPHNIDPSSAVTSDRKLLGRRRRNFQMLLTRF